MSSHMDRPQLPAEIWLAIFDHIDDTNMMAEYRLVCKNWKPLVDQCLYKSLSVNRRDDWTEERLCKLIDHFSNNPELCYLIQTIDLTPFGFQDALIDNFLKHATTSNLRVLKGLWAGSVMEMFLSFLKTSNLKLDKLEQLPSGYVSLPFVNLLLYFKETLTSAAIFICDTTDRIYMDILSNSFGEFKSLTNLRIKNDGALRNVQELDHLWKACANIESLTFQMYRTLNYALTNSSHDFKQWLEKDVQTSAATTYLDIRIHRKPRFNNEVGPELVQYLVYKCPNIKVFNVSNLNLAANQAIPLPHLNRLEAFELTSWRFKELDQLVHFLEVSRGRGNTIRLEYDVPKYDDDAPVCTVDAKKERGSDQTDYSLLINGSFDIIDTNTVDILSLFSEWKICDLCFDVSDELEHRLMQVLTYFSLTESLSIEVNNFHLEEPPQQFLFNELKKLEIRHADITASNLTEFCNLAPNLENLKLTTCFFEHQIRLHNSFLISLTLEAYYVDADHNGFNDYEECGNGIFLISIAASTYQLFASPDQPLLIIPNEASPENFGLEAHITIDIQCRSLRYLKVDLADFKFDIEFDSFGQIKSSNPAFENPRSMQNAIESGCA